MLLLGENVVHELSLESIKIIFRKYHLRDHVNSTAQPRDH